MGRDERDGCEAFPILIKDFLRRTGGTVLIPSFRSELDLDSNLLIHDVSPPDLRHVEEPAMLRC